MDAEHAEHGYCPTFRNESIQMLIVSLEIFVIFDAIPMIHRLPLIGCSACQDLTTIRVLRELAVHIITFDPLVCLLSEFAYS